MGVLDTITSSSPIEMPGYDIGVERLRNITFDEFATLVKVLSYSGARDIITPRRVITLYNVFYSSMYEKHPSILLEGNNIVFGITYDCEKNYYRILKSTNTRKEEYIESSGFNTIVKIFPILFDDFSRSYKGKIIRKEDLIRYYKDSGGYTGSIDSMEDLLLRATASLKLQDYLMDCICDHNKSTDNTQEMLLSSCTGINKNPDLLRNNMEDLFSTRVSFNQARNWVDIIPTIEDSTINFCVSTNANYDSVWDNTFEGVWGKIVGFYFKTILEKE